MEPGKEQLLKDAFAFLNGQSMGAIATVGPDNTPEAATVNFFVDTDWTVYIITSKDSRKVQNLRQNAHVAFVVGVEDIPNTAQMQADVTIVDDSSPDYNTSFQKIKESGKLNRDPMYDMYNNNYVVLKLKVTWLRWLYFDKSTGKAVYTVLIP